MNDTSSVDSPKGVVIDLSGDEPHDSDEFESSENEGVPNQGVIPKVKPGEAEEDNMGGDLDVDPNIPGSDAATVPARRYPRRTRKAPQHYIPRFNAGGKQSYHVEDGTLNLSYRGQRYHLKDGVVSVNLDSRAVGDNNVHPPTQYADGVINLCMEALESDMRHVMADWEVEEHILGLVMVQQYSIKKGVELFGERAEAATLKELTQLHDMDTYVPLFAGDLTKEERRKALEAFFFLVEKRNGEIKGRKVAIGSKQRTYEGYKKSDGTSPTVSTNGLIMTTAIDAHEGRDVAVVDVPGAFLNTTNDETILMCLRGALAEMMVRVDPKLYRKYVTTTPKGTPVLYVRLNKALYGLLRSALLFYKKLRKELEEMGFMVNPYDPCVANKMVKGSQMTVTWHVDDLKISHKKEDEVTKFILGLAKIYGPKLSIHRGKLHSYLGMDMDWSSPKRVKISMIKYLKAIIETFPELIKSTAESPAAEHLFQTRDGDPAQTFLPEEQAQAFHHTVAQLLFVAMRARPDIQTAVSFLTKRVKQPDEDDWGKLKRVLKYLKGTLYMKLTLSVDNLSTIRWYVDAAYGVHMDCKGHTGMVMTMGKGASMSFSRGQKLNARSSTEAELIGLDDAIPDILWGRFFLEGQGYTIEHNIVYQDNKSTILLATNGRASSSRNTKHIRNRYFLIKDLCDRSEIEIRHEGTESMLSDVLTKPKQGSAFKKLRAELMNCEVNYDDDAERARTHPSLIPSDEPEESGTNTGVQNTLVAGARLVGTPQPSNRRSVLGKQQIARARRWLVNNTEWGESIRSGKRSVPWDSKITRSKLGVGVERLSPVSVPGVGIRSGRIPTSSSGR